MTSILIGGDICPIGRSMPLFESGDAAGIFTDLCDEFRTADLSIVNLECPLIDEESPILKSGPVLGAKSGCIKGIRAVGVNLVNLANNHILDHGYQGLRNTLQVCGEAGIETVGVGDNLSDAGRVFCRKMKHVRISIMAFAEHECSIATKNTPGANPLNLIEYVRQMRGLRSRSDYIIALLHGGREYYPYPSPQLQQICRFMIEEGANAVICQHSHCPGCYEHYEGGYIVYGQGNLIFDRYPEKRGDWNRGFLVKVSLQARNITVDLVPYIQSDERVGARRMSMHEEAAFREDLKRRSARIREDGFVEQNWHDFCRANKYFYFSILRGHNRASRMLNRMTHFTDWLYSRRTLASLHNVIRCETHQEVLETLLREIQDNAGSS